MNPIQEKMFHVYEQIKRICEEHQLRFYAAGGTKIGAVLWKGIIPWDDDIDLVMPFEDLRRLVAILSSHSFENLGCFDGIHAPYSDIIGVKVFDKQTMFTSSNLLNRPEAFTGVFVDIFPMIGSPSDVDGFVTELNTLRDELFKKRLFGDSVDENMQLVGQLEEMMTRHPFDASERVLNVANPTAELFLREEFLDTLDMEFETSSIPVSRFYDAHLKQQYGSYTKDWPEEKRVHLHEEFALLDVEKGIDFYQEGIATSPIANYIAKMGDMKAHLEAQIFAIDDLRKQVEREKKEWMVKHQQLSSDCESLSRDVETLQLAKSEVEQQLTNVLTSTSWKITRPLRRLAEKLHQMKERKKL